MCTKLSRNDSLCGFLRFAILPPLATLVVAAAACTGTDAPLSPGRRPVGRQPGDRCRPGNGLLRDLYGRAAGGPAIHAGTVSLSNDADHLFVTYATDAGWTLGSTALFVGGSVDDIPRNPAGNPRVGHFPYSAAHAPGTTRYTYSIPLDDLQHTRVIAAYAAVHNGDHEEGAWAAGERINATGPWATGRRTSRKRVAAR